MNIDKEIVKSLFTVAQIPVIDVWQIPNQYWPDTHNYDNVRSVSPWWLVHTPYGLIEIGWRKRVLQIDWSRTNVKANVTDENVTKTETMVHAWDYSKAVECLSVLAKEFSQLLNKEPVMCPFCKEDDFDLIGLKDHLQKYCEPYMNTKGI